MDDDTFKTGILSRLDKIVVLLSISCNLSKALLEKPQTETPVRQETGVEPADTAPDSDKFLINDEMQEDYDRAIQKWKSGKEL